MTNIIRIPNTCNSNIEKKKRNYINFRSDCAKQLGVLKIMKIVRF